MNGALLRAWRQPLSLALLLIACQPNTRAASAPAAAAPLASSPPPRSPAPAPSPELQARSAMFQRLVRDIRAYHVFPEAWSEQDWSADVPRLERMVLDAPDRATLLIALSRVSGSLRDGHLGFIPTGGWPSTGIAVLPIGLFQTGSALEPAFIVRRAAPETGLAVGDQLVSYDGIEVSHLLDHFRFELDRASPGARATRLTELLQWRRTETHPGVMGSSVALRVQREGQLVDATLAFAPNAPPPPTSTPDGPVCRGPRRDYGPDYLLVEASPRVCLYRGLDAQHRPYPIVRHVSFLYNAPDGIDHEAIQADHELVRRFLADTPHLAGLFLDLRDNNGGHHADLFLPWYLPQPYAGSQRWIRLHPDLDDRLRLAQALWNTAAADEYVRRAARGDTWWVAPFDCAPSECPPQTDALLTRAPIALWVGPSCLSSCDNFVYIWTQQHRGPTVGAPAAAMATSNRYPIEVRLDDEPLGDLTVALSGTRASEQSPWLEGNPAPVDHPVEPSWPESGYAQRMVEVSIEALGTARASRTQSHERASKRAARPPLR
ncbi:MAG TPA: hypothetical protein VMG12_42390 [Polyangiaceae bacterium]|nr:hypothetical protein [Polyangiaceae bacterium]